MRVLFASANFGEQVVGGAQLSIRFVAEELAARGHEVAVLIVDPHGPRESVTPAGVRVFKVAPRNLYWHRAPRPSAPKRLAWHVVDRFAPLLTGPFERVIRRFRPDIVHTNVLSGLTVAIWRATQMLDVPSIHTVHDYYLLCVSSAMRRSGENCARPCASCQAFSAPSRRAARLVSGVIFISEHMRTTHEAAGVFASDACTTEIIGAYDRREGGVRPTHRGPLRLGFLGRLAPDKGLDHLLCELRSLDTNSYVLRVGGAGAPRYEEQLRRLAVGMPVTFLGRVEPAPFFASLRGPCVGVGRRGCGCGAGGWW